VSIRGGKGLVNRGGKYDPGTHRFLEETAPVVEERNRVKEGGQNPPLRRGGIKDHGSSSIGVKKRCFNLIRPRGLS